MKKLLRVEVENDMLEDGPNFGSSPRWTYYLFCNKVFQHGGKNPREVKRRFMQTVKGETRDEAAKCLEGLFRNKSYVLTGVKP